MWNLFSFACVLIWKRPFLVRQGVCDHEYFSELRNVCMIVQLSIIISWNVALSDKVVLN